jgi:hypothetical protein
VCVHGGRCVRSGCVCAHDSVCGCLPSCVCVCWCLHQVPPFVYSHQTLGYILTHLPQVSAPLCVCLYVRTRTPCVSKLYTRVPMHKTHATHTLM